MSGFFAGAKPSRNQASTCWFSESSSSLVSSLISPNHRSSVTRPPSSSRRWHPPKADGHCACSCCAHEASSGQRWCARRRSSAFSGYFSKLMKCNLCKVTSGLSRTKTSNACQRVRKLSPVPKPLSATIISGRGWLGKRSGRRFPPRKT